LLHVLKAYLTKVGCLQVGLLDVLAEDGALHLIPPLSKMPPAMQQRLQNFPPSEVVKCYHELLSKNQLKKSRQEESLVWELANLFTAKTSGQQPE
jgi:hypothetical protein